MQRESQLCIPQTDMTREQYAAIYRESFSVGSKSQSEEKVSGSFPNGGQNGEIAQSGIDMKRLENRSDFPPVTFQNKPGTGRIGFMCDCYQRVFGPAPTPAPTVLALLGALIAYSGEHRYVAGAFLLIAVWWFVDYIKETR